MFARKVLSFFLVISMTVILFSGCAGKMGVTYSYDAKYTIHTLESQILSENQALKLSWDNQTKGIRFEEKQTGKIWSNVAEGKETSTIDCYVQDVRIFQTKFLSGLEAIRANKLSAEKIKDGIQLTYYFDEEEISIPVTYTLREDSLCMAINGAKIQEKGEKYRLVSVMPSPSFTSVRQDAPDSYIFTSGGIGAIVDVGENADGKREISMGSGNVSALSTDSSVNSLESSGIRAGGLKTGEHTLFYIAENSAEAVNMRVAAGDTTSNYSSIYPIFCLTDTDRVKAKQTTAGDVDLLSDRVQSTISVGLYPLSGENADYNGMAKCYRRYLEKKGLLFEGKKDYSSPYAVTALGGVMTTSSIAGVPTMTLKKMTDFSQAGEMIESLIRDTGVKPVVRLKGYGESGLNTGEIAGGYKFASVFGGDKGQKKLEETCASLGVALFTDFDVVKYSKSGSGFSYANDAAKTATLHTAEFSLVNVPLRDNNEKMSYRLLARGKIDKALGKLLKMCEKKDVSGICLSYFGAKSYSDYTDIRYAVAGQMEEDVKAGILKLRESGMSLAGSASAYYAAGLLDTVFDAPLEKTGQFQYAKEIPFYQMVFTGVTPLYSAPLNIASNPAEKLMLAAASGTGIGFSVLKHFENEYMETGVEKLYACGYDNCKEQIQSSLQTYAEIYNAVAGVKIDRYDFVDENITKTRFENGVTVYANHSSTTVQSPVGELAGYGFKMEEGR